MIGSPRHVERAAFASAPPRIASVVGEGRRGATRPAVLRLIAPLLALALLLLAGVVPALAREEIRSFTTVTTLRTDGSVDVYETIEVGSEADQIRHGIFRDIPISLINDDNSRLRSDLNVVGVTRDGRDEPYSVETPYAGFKRIKIGDGDVFLDPGVYTYVIHYTMTRMGRSFDDHDELFWNATGNYWNFPILRAQATLIVPDGAIISGSVAYTGVPGSQKQAASASGQTAGKVTYTTTRTLAPGEGLSVAVKFQKGVLVAPSGLTALGYWLSDHRSLVFPTFAALIVLLYNFLAWSAVGRDPQKGTIIPLFHPPKDLSPAKVHYINRMGFRQSGWTALTSSIFDLGVKGLVIIGKAGKSTTITSTGAAGSENLPPEETGIFNFIRSRGVVTIDKTDGPQLNTKRGELVTTITSQSGETYFKNNVLYTLGGVALSALMLGALVWLDVIDPVVLVIAVVVAIVIGVFIGVLSGTGAGSIVGKLFGVVWLVIIGANIFGSSLSFASGIRIDTGLVGAVSIVVIEIVFAFLMRAPTIAGRRLMDQIDGFKMYLETAEKNRLNYVEKGEPQMTVSRFESILPFAIALSVEKPWSQRFEADLARNAVADAQGGYSPVWYTGGDWSRSSSSFSNVVSSMATGMSAAMVAAQPSSSSGSGFSGGGGSGGGGGGGGGGGW